MCKFESVIFDWIRSLLSPFAVYLGQVKTSKQMYMNISSFWIVSCNVRKNENRYS